VASSPGVGVTSLAAAPLLQGVHTGAASTSAGSPGRERPLGAQPGQGAGTDPSDAGHGPPEPAREGSAGAAGLRPRETGDAQPMEPPSSHPLVARSSAAGATPAV